jgi:RNA polymerase sigma-70 factor, ECF subfamily
MSAPHLNAVVTMTPASTYVHFAPYVRRRLAGLGVRDADLPDLCHEVFLVVHDNERLLPAVGHMELWLRAICRRVAAGYRRRAGHRLEVLGFDTAAEYADPDAGAADDADVGGKLALLRRALNLLDDESRDLLALHDAGEMSLTELAKLVAHDRKTVRSRLARARRRVSRWLGDGAAPSAGLPLATAVRTTPPASPFMRDKAARGRAAGCVASELEILRISPEHCSGAVGNVTVSDWRGPTVGAAAIESAIGQAPHTLEKCGGEIVYLALIEPTMLPPALETRQKIVDAIELVGPYFKSFAVVVLGDNGRINQPILEGLMLLARPRFPMRFFASVQAAADWLCETTARGCAGPLDPRQLADAAERLRRIETDGGQENRHARVLASV